MAIIRWLLRSIHSGVRLGRAQRKTAPRQRARLSFVGLALLALLLVTAVLPAVAREPAPPPEVAGSPVSAAPQLLQQGKQLYQGGRFVEAATVWQQAAIEYEAAGEWLNLAQILNYLSLAYQDLGEWERARAAIEKSLNLLSNQNQREGKSEAIRAQALNAFGRLQLATGQTEAALETWKAAEAAYLAAGNQTGRLGSQINQAQALQYLGHYRQAKTLLEKLLDELLAQPDTALKADGLRSLGTVLQRVGDLLRSKEILEQSWAISQRLGATAGTGAALLGIGNIARDLDQYDVALAYYQQAAKMAQDPLARAQAQLNQLSLLVDTEKRSLASALVPQIESDLSELPPSRASVDARVNLAESLMKLSAGGGEAFGPRTSGGTPAGAGPLASPLQGLGNKQQTPTAGPLKVAGLLATAVREARQLGDPRAEASALNQLAKLYEQTQQWEESQNLAQLSLQIAQKIDATDQVARAAWQLGRTLKEKGDIAAATAAYTEAVNALANLRSDLVAINREVQFNFKESVEPVYRELVSLLLGAGAGQANLRKAREVIEALQLAELDNFFKDACVETHPVRVEGIDAQAAVIYPIILSDRLEVIVSLPNSPSRHYATPLPGPEIEKNIKKLYSSLYIGYSSNERLRLSQKVYDWLIRPAEADLASHGIKTLVFVLDGVFRSLPMAALYDGKQYLVEKYSVAISPGLQLFPQGLSRNQLKILAVGLAEARQGFSALPGVEAEVKQIAVLANSKVLLNRQFTRASFKDQINGTEFPVVHLATHGQFSSNPEETFLLTWDGRIAVKDLDRLLQARGQENLNPIELLVLSACQTAAGDGRAALGLAGFALRSGARSTLATLWAVSDKSTANLMTEFYQKLTQPQQNITKAEALRQAQLALLKNPQYSHPYFWAPFVLVGNWL
ncbi:CHAT domain-containing protein [Kamptonema formosum]|uniref:CHAT domain-containing protein n=1 Tax=Kamptonema formosum TaxID=331992 RepID=UPI000376F6A0|nr:CHAT domain-containing protein [Oscillatoria sp. PCC 10802]